MLLDINQINLYGAESVPGFKFQKHDNVDSDYQHKKYLL